MDSSIVCRACLTTISMEYIDLETPLYNDTTFLDCFNFCTKLEANLDDELPNNICVACGNSLQIAFDFIKASSDADRMLRESLLFREEFQCLEDSKDQLTDDFAIVKEEENLIEYNADYVEEETINTEEIKEEKAVELPSFEIVISNIEGENDDNKDTRVSADEEDNNWPVLSLEDEDPSDNGLDKGSLCEKMVANDEFDGHITTQMGNLAYECDECEEKFACKETLEMHKKAEHKSTHQRGNYVCGWCGEACDSRSKLRQHRLLDHHGQVPSSCLTCGEQFSDEPSLRRHVKKAHGIEKKAVPCPYCNKEYKNIALHIKCNHLDILKMPIPEDGSAKLSSTQCPYCFRHYQSKNVLKDHINTHTGERPYACDICGKAFHHKNIRDNHLLVHKPNMPKQQCDLCDFSTYSILSFRSHKSRHKRPVEKRYLCAFCPMRFVNPKKLHMHEDYKHGRGEKAFQCDVCQKKFIIKQKLKEHVLSVHTSGRPFVCPECNKTFKNDFQLRAHQKLHGDRQIDCPQCDKKFARQIDLRIHTRTHTGELPYECHLCEKRYAIRVRLTYHLQKHLGIKHKCQQCTSEFNSRSKLRLHMFKHIGMPYICDHCQMGYPNRVGLRRHSKSAHKLILTADDLAENRRRNEKNMRYDHLKVHDFQPTSVSGAENELEI